jgi:nitrogen fixation/metabolism regulation signal transduction histidine kinase
MKIGVVHGLSDQRLWLCHGDRFVGGLTVAAHALKDGDYDQVTSNDEIWRLARTFNVMIDVLRQRDRER